MGTKRTISRSILCAIVLTGLTSTDSLPQHIHGVVELGVVLESSTLAVSLTAPLSDVVGFEHAPERDEQVDRIQRATELLSNADEMFGLADAAGCKASEVSVDGPAYFTQGTEAEHNDDHRNDDGYHHSDHTHPQTSEHEEHAEINANYEWTCANVSELGALELRFADGFASVEKIEVQIVTSTGAQVLTADGQVGSIPLAPR